MMATRPTEKKRGFLSTVWSTWKLMGDQDETRDAYERALEEQESIDVAYGRIMLLGSAGVGKTSLKRSLMKLSFKRDTTSTIVSDVSSIRPFSHERHTMGEEQWREVTHEDEIEELAKFVAQSRSGSRAYSLLSTVAATALYPIAAMMDARSISAGKVQDIKERNVESILAEAREYAAHNVIDSSSVQPFLNIWDCGGQPVFLEILPAFLTPRTAFLLLFDASRDFTERWQSVQNVNGQQSLDEVVDETTGDLMVNWMSTIHSHLMKLEKDGGLSEYPRLFCVGTHGDSLASEEKKKVIETLQSQYKGKAFSELIQDSLIVDNTTSGQGDSEDPNLTKLQSALNVFVRKKLVVKTPVNWILFRKVLQMYGKNVIDKAEAHAIGVACQIPAADVPKVLMFYHEVGSVLFYPHLKGLREKVIINPKWFVETLGKVFTLEGREEGHTRLAWFLLHEKGILVRPFYVAIWRECKDHLNPDDMMELLVHFRLAAPVHTREYHNPSVKQYFLPAVLEGFDGDPQEAPPGYKLRAAPLHITFSTGFVPPGFFTRFATTMAGMSICELVFDYGIYRNRVSFLYGRQAIDHLTLTDLHHVIQVDVLRYVPESSSVTPFKRVCLDLLELLKECCKQVEGTLINHHGGMIDKSSKSINVSWGFCYVCGCDPSNDLHYLKVAKEQTCALPVHCQKKRDPRSLSHQESLWFKDIKEERPPTLPSVASAGKSIPDIIPSDKEVFSRSPIKKDAISLLIPIQSKWHELGLALGVSDDKLDGLSQRSYSDTIKLGNTIDYWRNEQAENATWQELIDAVEGPIIDNAAVGRAIRSKLLKN